MTSFFENSRAGIPTAIECSIVAGNRRPVDAVAAALNATPNAATVTIPENPVAAVFPFVGLRSSRVADGMRTGVIRCPSQQLASVRVRYQYGRAGSARCFSVMRSRPIHRHERAGLNFCRPLDGWSVFRSLLKNPQKSFGSLRVSLSQVLLFVIAHVEQHGRRMRQDVGAVRQGHVSE